MLIKCSRHANNLSFIITVTVILVLISYFSLLTDPVVKVSLASSNLEKSIAYWNGLLTLKIFEKSPKSVLLGFDENQAKLELVEIGKYILSTI